MFVYLQGKVGVYDVPRGFVSRTASSYLMPKYSVYFSPRSLPSLITDCVTQKRLERSVKLPTMDQRNELAKGSLRHGVGELKGKGEKRKENRKRK